MRAPISAPIGPPSRPTSTPTLSASLISSAFANPAIASTSFPRMALSSATRSSCRLEEASALRCTSVTVEV